LYFQEEMLVLDIVFVLRWWKAGGGVINGFRQIHSMIYFRPRFVKNRRTPGMQEN